jgi:ubiquitin-like protein Pup
MAEQVRRRKQTGAEAASGSAPSATLSRRGAALRKDIDDVIADIDGVLEENAEEFVKEYVQRGGE